MKWIWDLLWPWEWEHLWVGLLALGAWVFFMGFGILFWKMDNYRRWWLECERKRKREMERKIKNGSEDDLREIENDIWESEIERGPFVENENNLNND